MTTTTFLTPSDLLAAGLRLRPVVASSVLLPAGTCCAITGQPIAAGYRVAEMVTGATAEFLDCFRGGVDGWVSESAARCFKAANPRAGNPTARSVMIFGDGTCHLPMISRASAREQSRACWSELVREVWPERLGQQSLIILTTDTKKRLWIRARVGALGSRTPLLVYDSATALNEVRLLDWSALLDCLAVIEDVYSLGFPKAIIASGLHGAWKVAQEVGWKDTARQEVRIRPWRARGEFAVALLIAQKREEAG